MAALDDLKSAIEAAAEGTDSAWAQAIAEAIEAYLLSGELGVNAVDGEFCAIEEEGS